MRTAVCTILCLVMITILIGGIPFSVRAESDYSRRITVLEKDVSEIRADSLATMKQVSTNTGVLNDLRADVQRHHDSQAGYPAFLAVLDTKLDWLLTGIGMVLVGGAGWSWSRVRYSNRVAEELRKHAEIVLRHQEVLNGINEASQKSVMDKLQIVQDGAQSAYSEANTVNRKIESLGESIREHQKET